MLKKSIVISLLTVSLTGVASSQVLNQVALTINKKPITLAEFNYLFSKNRDVKAAVDSAQVADYVSLFVNYKLKVEDALGQKFDTASSFKTELAGYRKQLAAPYLTDTTVDRIVMQEAYSHMLFDVRASHILIPLKADATSADTLVAYNKAMEVRKLVMANRPFDSLAIAYSGDPSAKHNGGDLGFFTAFRMVYPFEEAAYKLKVGEVSPPVRTRFGYHLIKVTDKRPARGEVKVAHIMMLVPNNATTLDWSNARSRIDVIRDSVMHGSDFAQMAAKYSDDKATAKSGGEVAPFGIGRVIPVFEDAAFSLTVVGEVSQPVRSPYGWHIIKLIEKYPIPSFGDVRQKIKDGITRDERNGAGRDAFVKKLKSGYGYKDYIKNALAVVNLIDSSFAKGNWSTQSAQRMAKPVFSFNRQKFTQYQFAQYLAAHEGKMPVDKMLFTNEMMNAMAADTLLAYESSTLEAKYPTFRFLMNEYHDGMLLFDISTQKVWNKASTDTVGLQQFYMENRGNYVQPLLEHAAIAVYADSLSAFRAKHAVDSIGFANLVVDSLKQVLNRSIKPTNFASGWYQPQDHLLLSKLPQKQGVYVVADKNASPVLVVVEGTKQNYLPELSEVKGIVTSDYQEKLDLDWIKQLRIKYLIDINWAVLKTLIKE
mgnify:CR=1 FL=1|jgi:Parvulin-like peptidyl-prolyl isomerase